MTAIIALKEKGRVVIGTDGRTSAGQYGFTIKGEDGFKVRRVNGSPECLIANSGDCDKCRTIANIPNLLNGRSDVNYSYIVNNTLIEMYNNLKKANFTEKSDDYVSFGTSTIIATKNHIFKITSYGEVLEADTIATIGCGEDLILCKYKQIKDLPMTAEEKVIECLKHSINNAEGVGYPITILSTDSKDYKVIQEDC